MTYRHTYHTGGEALIDPAISVSNAINGLKGRGQKAEAAELIKRFLNGWDGDGYMACPLRRQMVDGIRSLIRTNKKMAIELLIDELEDLMLEEKSRTTGLTGKPDSNIFHIGKVNAW